MENEELMNCVSINKIKGDYMKNQIEIKFKSLPENEAFARTCVSAFCLQLNPTLDEIGDIKTAVSEAVTNCVVHAYPNKVGEITMLLNRTDDKIHITIKDNGVGITDIDKALTPFYTTKPDEERSGMGFTVMDSFMDSLVVRNNGAKGLIVEMSKRIENKQAV